MALLRRTFSEEALRSTLLAASAAVRSRCAFCSAATTFSICGEGGGVGIRDYSGGAQGVTEGAESTDDSGQAPAGVLHTFSPSGGAQGGRRGQIWDKHRPE
eukprot:421778-Prorocentrum_minimum.AAC.3